ncbi:MAG TPA: glycosyltransferase [Patescibacteria group bacterium]|nr:glycosyltransferase [Patescibacteria group bacterium]
MPTTLPSLSIVIPIYNEEKSVEKILAQYKDFAKKYKFELICVDNGSTDNSASILKKISSNRQYRFVKVVKVVKNVGYGHGIMSGVKKANGDLISWTHADMQTHPKDVFKAYDLYLKSNERKVLIKGIRVNRLFLDSFVSFVMGIVASVALGGVYYEINAQPKLFSKELVKKLGDSPDDFLLDLYLLWIAKKLGYKTISFKVEFLKRLHGKSKWAYSFGSRFKMILRTFLYIFELSEGTIS